MQRLDFRFPSTYAVNMELFSGREIEQNNRTVETQTAFSWRHGKSPNEKSSKTF